MKVILLKDVPKLGKKDDIKEVKSGYAYNMLFKNKLAVEATDDRIDKIEALKKSSELMAQKMEEELRSLIDSLNNKTFEMKVPANDKGHLFSRLKLDDVIKAIGKGEDIKEIIKFPEIKSLGDFDIKLERGEKRGKFTLHLS